MLPKPYIYKGVNLSEYLLKLEKYRALIPKFPSEDAPRLPDLFSPELLRFEEVECIESGDPRSKKFVCPDCNHTFTNRQGLHQHIGKVHRDANKNYPCPQCEKTFKHKHAVKFHIAQVHLKATRVSCNVCNKGFYNKYELKKHADKYHPGVNINT